jgi:cyanate permease
VTKPPEEKPIPVWQKLAALVVAALVIACVVVFRGHLGADFVPLDASRVGPNLIASMIVWAILFVLAVLLWPPTRRRMHRFIDAKIAPLHARHDEHVKHLERLGRSLAALHEKLDKPQDGV